MNIMKHASQKGFTLIEVLLVIAILAILAAVVIVAINPSKQLASARDAQRMSDVYSILNAIHQYAVDNDGEYPAEITTDNREICKTTSVTCIDETDLTVLTENETYLVSVPEDPLCPFDSAYCSENGTGYFVELTDGGRISVSAPSVETKDDISVTR